VRIDLWGNVHLTLLGAQLDDSLLRFSKNLYQYEKLLVDLHYHLSLAFCGVAMNGDYFSLAIDLGAVFIQTSSQVDHHLD